MNKKKMIPIIITSVFLLACLICMIVCTVLLAKQTDSDTNPPDTNQSSVSTTTGPMPNTDPTTTDKLPDSTDAPPVTTDPIIKDSMPMGTYYYVAGTQNTWMIHTSNANRILDSHVPNIFINADGSCIFTADTQPYFGNWSSNDNIITFADNAEFITSSYPISVEHDDSWMNAHNSPESVPFTCTYDATYQIIRIQHGVDSIEFKYFENADSAALWLAQYADGDGSIVMPSYFSDYRTMIK